MEHYDYSTLDELVHQVTKVEIQLKWGVSTRDLCWTPSLIGFKRKSKNIPNVDKVNHGY